MMKLSIFFFSHTTWKLKRSATGQSVCNMTRQARWRKPASWWNQQPRWNLLFQNGHLLSISSTIFTVNFALKIENKYRELKLSFKGFLKRQFTRRLCVLAIQACGIQNDLINNFSHSKVLCDYYTDFKREHQMIKSHSYKLPANDKRGKIKKISPRLQWSPCCPAGEQRMNILAGNLIVPAHCFRAFIS